MNKIGIIGAGTGTLPTEVLRMAKEANVEIVELDKDRPGVGTKQYFDIVQSDAEDPGIPNFTAHYLRMSNAKKFSPEYHVLQYVRFYLGDPQYQGEFVCVAEFDFT